MQVTRMQFKMAIGYGILQADLLSPSSVQSLRDVAETAPEFGTNYDCGCPADLAGLCYNGVSREPRVVGVTQFATAFDRAMIDLLPAFKNAPEDAKIQVTR